VNAAERSALIAQAYLYAAKGIENENLTVFSAHALRSLGEVLATAEGIQDHESPFVSGGQHAYEFEFGNVDNWLNVLFLPGFTMGRGADDFVVLARVGSGPDTEIGAHSEFTSRSTDTIRRAVERGFAAFNADLAGTS
jgi:hypothetical protein